MVDIICADVMEWAESYDGEPFHAMLCDPPYGLEFMGKEWDSFKADAWLTGAGFSKPGIGERKTAWPSYGMSTPFGGANPTCAICGGRLRGAKKCDCDNPDWRVKGKSVEQAKYPTAQTLAYQVAMNQYFAALTAHLLPGAWIMAFASSRGWHRLAVAIEDAGMVIQPSIFGWANGQSFPKASRIDTQIDKAAGMLKAREIEYRPITYPDSDCWGIPNRNTDGTNHNPTSYSKPGNIEHGRRPHSRAATPLARAWEGHRYGGQVLKNSLEPIICGQKPWEGKRLDCIVETGAGALNVDGGRIALTPECDTSKMQNQHVCGKTTFGQGLPAGAIVPKWKPAGRWPPNFYLQHSPLCQAVTVAETCPDCSGTGTQRRLDWTTTPRPPTREAMEKWRASDDDIIEVPCKLCGGTGLCQARGTRRVKGSAPQGQKGDWAGGDSSYGGGFKEKWPAQKYADASGHETVSRYACAIHCQDCGHAWIAEERGPCVECEGEGEWTCQVRRLDEQAGETSTTGKRSEQSRNASVQGTQWLPDNHRSTEYPNERGGPSRFFPNLDWSLDVAEALANSDPVRYCAKASRAERDAGLDELPLQLTTTADKWQVKDRRSGTARQPTEWKQKPVRCSHPTVKPLSLNKWLATLLLPPPIYAPRRLLVPFGGVCSEAIGALLAGWEHITVIEMSQGYCDIGAARVRFWQGWSERTGLMEPRAILKAARRDNDRDTPESQPPLF